MNHCLQSFSNILSLSECFLSSMIVFKGPYEFLKDQKVCGRGKNGVDEALLIPLVIKSKL